MTDQDLIDLLRTCTPRPLPAAVSTYVQPQHRPTFHRQRMTWVAAAVAAAAMLMIANLQSSPAPDLPGLPILGRYRDAAHITEDAVLQIVDADAVRFHTAHHPEGIDP